MAVLCLLRLLKKTPWNLHQLLMHGLNNVNNWLTSKRICVNADETKYMIFSHRKLLHLTNIKIGFATIEESNNIKFLGILFDKHLTFKNHEDVIAGKIS